MKSLFIAVLLLTTSVYGQNTNSLLFDGVDDGVSGTASSQLDVTNTNNVTMCAWIKTSVTSGSRRVFTHGNVSSNDQQYAMNVDGGKIYFLAGSGEFEQNGANLSNTIINTGIWTNISMTYDGSAVRLYVNGSLDFENFVTDNFPANPIGNFYIGIKRDGAERFTGNIDDVHVWNTALDSTQIQEYMYCPPTAGDSGLVGFWDFEEGTGTSTMDQTANGSNGTLNGGVTWSTDITFCTATFNSLQDTITACGTDSVQLDAGSGFSTYSWSTGAGAQATYVSSSGMYYVTVTDSCGCSAGDSVYVSLSNLAITASTVPTDCENTANGIISSSSSGGISPYLFAWSNSASTSSINSLGVGSYSLTVADSIGCSIDTIISITAEDTINPSVVTQNLTIYLDASGVASITAAQVDNGSTDNCDIDSLYLDITDFDCSDVGVNSVTITAVDVNSNSSSTTADITVMDTISPTMVSQNLTIYLDASGVASITAAQVDSGSTDNCSFDLSLSQSDFTCEDEGVITVALIGVDSTGNTSVDSFDVQVVDTTFHVNEIQGLDSLPQTTVSSYFVDSIAGAVYQWSAVNGSLSANGASAQVTWSQDFLSGQVSVMQTVEQGCSDSTSKIITLWLTGIDNLSLTEEINLFPNPTRDKVFISLKDGQLESSDVRVYSNAGRLVLSERNLTLNQSNYEVDLSSFSAGQYNIVISSGGKTNQYKVILN